MEIKEIYVEGETLVIKGKEENSNESKTN